MQRSPALKIGVILGLLVLLLVPISMIRGLVDERSQRRDGVLEDIARSSSGAQKITGPLLVVPYTRTVHDTVSDPKTGEKREFSRQENGRLHFLPELLSVDAALRTEERKRGIYRARLYHGTNRLSGHFEIPPFYGFGAMPADYRFGTPFVVVGVRDIRGIENTPLLATGGHELPFQPGTLGSFLGEGMHVLLKGVDAAADGRIGFAFELRLLGSSAFDLAPVGRETRVDLQADWPHPGFTGNFLPASRSIDADGFRAHWATSFFATNMEQLLRDCNGTGGERCQAFHAQSFGVSLVDPVDQYLKTERAIKYALLLVGLGFAGFFLFEVLRRIELHPVQYGLVGLALAVFYLLLLSLSEHIGFGRAYAVSTLACLALLASYFTAVLQSARRGLGFAGTLGALYLLLYGVLSSEDYALLMGSLLVFGLLSAVMVLTRRVRWSEAGVVA